jgi:hypothetical protein
MSIEGIPLNLRAAARAFPGVQGVTVAGSWVKHGNKWAIPCDIKIESPANGLVPGTTQWYLVVTSDYPYGAIKLYPAKIGGLVQTFQHQAFNGPGNELKPWRAGALCLDSTLSFLGRPVGQAEPFDATGPRSRLVWHLQRAVAWLSAAASDKLVYSGDPFELPEFPIGDTEILAIAHSEDATSFSTWQTRSETFGLVELVPLAGCAGVLVTRRFNKLNGEKVVSCAWGRGVAEGTNETGGWLRLPAIPAIAPWQAPRTWEELWQACRGLGIERSIPFWRTVNRLRDGKPHFLLIGFPMPSKIRGEPVVMHWQPIHLPPLSYGKVELRGFRTKDDPKIHQLCDQKTILRGGAAVNWQRSENWAPDTLASRGRLAENVRSLRAVIIGCGTLGSAVAELLVRAGLYRIVLVDGQLLEAGNLCRHNLLLSDIKKNKAVQLARRLTQTNPHIEAIAIESDFPFVDDKDRKELQNVNLVIDCSADDTVIRNMGAFAWGQEVRFASIWLGLMARRIYCFTADGQRFPTQTFDRMVHPWLVRERGEVGVEEYPREGVGCWNPVFPARVDDIWLLAAAAVKRIENSVTRPGWGTKLAVFEQREDKDGFSGVQRLDGGSGCPLMSTAPPISDLVSVSAPNTSKS